MQVDEPSAFATIMQQQASQAGAGLSMDRQQQGGQQQQQQNQQDQHQQQQQSSSRDATDQEDSPVLGYEKERLMNIQANEQLMASLGLQGRPSEHGSGSRKVH